MSCTYHTFNLNPLWLQLNNNYIPEKRNFSGILGFRQQRSRRVGVRCVTISLSAQ